MEDFSRAVQPWTPLAIQACAAMGAYTAGLAAAQGLGMWLRVSSATPFAAPLAGMLGVGAASAMAGQATLRCQEYQVQRQSPLELSTWRSGMRMDDLLVDAAMGIVIFKVLWDAWTFFSVDGRGVSLCASVCLGGGACS
jgi:hypothetical protein